MSRSKFYGLKAEEKKAIFDNISNETEMPAFAVEKIECLFVDLDASTHTAKRKLRWVANSPEGFFLVCSPQAAIGTSQKCS